MIVLASNKEVLGFRNVEKKEWISEVAWQLIEDRRAAKYDMLMGNEEEKPAVSVVSREIDKATKKSSRKDKRGFRDDLAHEAHSAAEGDTGTVYKITKTVTGGYFQQDNSGEG